MIFHASEMGRVVHCPGSKQISDAYPQPESTDPDEGTVAHGIAAQVLSGDAELESFLGQSINNIYVDQDLLYHVQTYTDECDESGSIEKQEYMEDGNDQLIGTPDYWVYDDAYRVLKVKDLKFGYGIVDVYENWQLLSYTALLFDRHSVIRDRCKTVELTVVQPRAQHPEGPVRRWAFDAKLQRNYRNNIVHAMEAAGMSDAPCTTGAWCRYCPGLLHCHTAKAAVGYTLEYASAMAHTRITPDMLGLELELVARAVAMLGQRQTALEEEGIAMSREGKVIPGWEVSSTPTPLAWTVDPFTIGDAMKVDLRKPPAPITPTQAITRKLLPKATVEAIAARGQGKMKLKRVDDAKAKRILS